MGSFATEIEDEPSNTRFFAEETDIVDGTYNRVINMEFEIKVLVCHSVVNYGWKLYECRSYVMLCDVHNDPPAIEDGRRGVRGGGLV